MQKVVGSNPSADPETREWAAGDADLASVRDDPALRV
jgi:hypothetical protein